MKKKILACSILGVLSVFGLAYGRSIPGVTRPYDPAAYYSETAISVRDSPSPFALMDLARNGFQVKDVTRKIKSELSQVQTYAQALLSSVKLNNKIKDMTGISGSVSQQMMHDVNNEFIQSENINKAGHLDDAEVKTIFRTTETVNDPTKVFDWRTQQKWLNTFYENTLDGAQANMVDTKSRINAVQNIVSVSDKVEGSLAAQQVNTDINAIYSAEAARKNALIANYAALEAAHNLYLNDNQLHAAQETKNNMTIRVANPDNMEETDKKYIKPQPKGFVDF